MVGPIPSGSSTSSNDSIDYPEEAFGLFEKKPTRLKPAGYALVFVLVSAFVVGLVQFAVPPKARQFEEFKKKEQVEFSIKGMPFKLTRETK